MAQARSEPAYLAVWVVLGAGLGASLYDPAFATLGRIFGADARRPITILTLAGGFASTAGWPTTHVLLGAVGWRGTYLVYAALMAAICAPLHAFALPRSRAATRLRRRARPGNRPRCCRRAASAFVLVTAAFTAYAFVPSALSAHLLAIFGRTGIDAATVVFIGTLFGPAQVAARVTELAFGRNMHPLLVGARGGRDAGAGLCAAGAVRHIGAAGCRFRADVRRRQRARSPSRAARCRSRCSAPRATARLMGRISGFWLVMQSAAPLVMAFVAERASDATALAFAAGFAVVALACFAAIRRPGG